VQAAVTELETARGLEQKEREQDLERVHESRG